MRVTPRGEQKLCVAISDVQLVLRFAIVPELNTTKHSLSKSPVVHCQQH